MKILGILLLILIVGQLIGFGMVMLYNKFFKKEEK